MKNPKMITLCIIACALIFGACRDDSNNQTKIMERGQLKLSCSDITVKVGEEFVVSADCVGNPAIFNTEVRWKLGLLENGIIGYKRDDWPTWDPDKAVAWNEIVNDIVDPFKGTEFIAQRPGVAELCVLDSNSNVISDICKITVVEKEEPIEEKIQDKNESTQGVLYSKGGTTILLKNTLPFTVNYKFGDKLYSSCEILNVSVGDISFMGIGIDIEYKKTFDSDGMGGQCTFWWKLYDSSNTLIEDGPVTQYNASVGEKFKDSFRILEDLGAETYTLEFVDYH